MNNYQVDRDKWSKLSIFDQMGNTYSEVGRAFNAKKKGDSERAWNAVVRALDLFDATSWHLAAIKSGKLREVRRARELFLSEFLDDKDWQIEEYLRHFALTARIRKFS
ncbi:MAG: hypothetical protein ABI210_03665 [Abditibacteriaceae bacterium]